MTDFYGYGNLHGKFWAIGMEEGGDSNTLLPRVVGWESLGAGPTVDIQAMHAHLGQSHWFGIFGPAQPTWQGVIKIVLAATRTEVGHGNTAQDYQHNKFARLDSDTAMLDLMPLPSPSSNEWAYQDLYRTREQYMAALAPQRIARLKELIREHRPSVVIMLSKTYLNDYWRKLCIGLKEEKYIPNGLGTFGGKKSKSWLYGRTKICTFIVCDHPASWVPSGYYEAIGKQLRSFTTQT